MADDDDTRLNTSGLWDPFSNTFININPFNDRNSRNNRNNRNSSGVAANWAPRSIPVPTQAYETGLPSYLTMPAMRPPLQTQQQQFPSYDQNAWQQTLENIYRNVLRNVLGGQAGAAGPWYRDLLR